MTAKAPQNLDLRGTPCPMNFVRIKLELDRIPLGDRLIVTADGGATGGDILRSLRDQGFIVENVHEKNGVLMFVVTAPAKPTPRQ